jgi:protein disulfide-isomerase
MNRRNVLVAAGALLGFAIVGAASEPVYDEQVDARQQIAAAIKTASQRTKPAKNIVLVFGANWCPDCHVLDEQMQKPGLASLIEKSFVVVKIAVGRMDKNVDVAKEYGVPIKNGIPALAILDSRGKLLYAQEQGQLADARHMSFESIKALFEQWKPHQ